MSKNYRKVWMPHHHNCDSNGLIWEHRVKAEMKLCRYLLAEEVVHHINGIPDDNRFENLMVFETSSDHTRFHKSHNPELILNANGSYRCKKEINEFVCLICGKKFKTTQKEAKYCSYNCCNKSQRSDLYNEDIDDVFRSIYENGFAATGRKYNVSDNTVKRFCKYCKVPHLAKEFKGWYATNK